MYSLPPVDPPTPSVAVIDERWTAPAAAAPIVPAPVAAARVDPRIAAGVAAVLAEAPERDPAPNRQTGLQPSAYGVDPAAAEKFAKRFSEAQRPACLSPATGGLGLFAIPLIAVQAIRGKCSMP